MLLAMHSLARVRWLVRRAAALGAFLLCMRVEAALIVSELDQNVTVVQEQAIMVFDTLRGSQTTLIRLETRGATKPFTILFPVKGKANTHFGHIRSFKNMLRQLHPVSATIRNIDVKMTSWVGSCVIPEVGVEPNEEVLGRIRNLKLGVHEFLRDGTATRQWLMQRGAHLTAGQLAWMRDLRKQGWTFLAVEVTPPSSDDPTEPLLSPIVAYTHKAENPAFNVHQPPPSLTGAQDQSRVPLELVILSEWPVGSESEGDLELLMSKPITAVQLERLRKRARGFPWDYQSDGHLTGYRLNDRTQFDVLRFTKMKVLPEKMPVAKKRMRLIDLNLPIEVILLGIWVTVWAWRGSSRRFRLRDNSRRL